MFTLYKTQELESQARIAGVRAVVGKEEGVIKLLSAIVRIPDDGDRWFRAIVITIPG